MSDPLLQPIDGKECETLAEKKPQIGHDDPLLQSTDEKECQIMAEMASQPDLDGPIVQPVDRKECEMVAGKKLEIGQDDPLPVSTDEECQSVAEKEHQPDLDDPPFCQPQAEKEFQPDVKVKEKVFNISSSTSELNGEESELQPESIAGAAEADDIEYYTLNEENQYFPMILKRTHVTGRYYVVLPRQITSKLPSAKVPVVLKNHGKCWNMFYNGGNAAKAFDIGWRKFVVDNELKIGDCCFFELTECSTAKLVFKVIIVRCMPSRFGETDGDTPQTVIIVE